MEMGKVGKLVVLYIRLDRCSTTQVHCIRRALVLTTWFWADLGSESGESDDLGQNHHHLDTDREEPGMKMGKVGNLVVIYIRLDRCSTPQVHCIRHALALTTWLWDKLGSESGKSDD